MKSRNKIYAIVMVIFLVLAAGFGGYTMMLTNQYNEDVAAKNNEIRELKNQIEIQEAANQAQQNVVVQKVTGLNQDRLARDMDIAEEFISYVTTWDSAKSYNDMRTDVLETYFGGTDVRSNSYTAAESHFINSFLAEVKEVKTTDGESHNPIDEYDYHCEYQSMQTQVVSIAADEYSYFSIVKCNGEMNTRSGTFRVIFMYTVNGDGELSGLDAYTISE